MQFRVDTLSKDKTRGLFVRCLLHLKLNFNFNSNFVGIEVPLNACCGSDAPYNCTPSILCGSPGSSVCKDPSTYASWDGLHLTEASYKLVAEGILEGPYASLPLIKTCTNFKRNTGTLKLPFSDPFSST